MEDILEFYKWNISSLSQKTPFLVQKFVYVLFILRNGTVKVT